MRRILFVLSACLCLAVPALAVSADSLMRRSAAFFQGGKGLSLDFEVEVRYAANGEKGFQKGSLLLGERNKFRLKAAGMDFYSDGVNLWQYNPAQKQVMVKLMADLETQFHPSEILFKYLGCKAVSARSEKWLDQVVDVVVLDPSRYKGQFKEMEVWLDPRSGAPLRLKTVDNLGNLSWYKVGNLKKIALPKDSEFVFKTPMGVDEIDMR